EIKDVKMNKLSLDTYKTERIKREEESVSEVAATHETKQKNSSTEKESTPRKQASARSTIRVNIDRLDTLMNLFEELVIDRGRLEQISMELDHNDLRET